MLPLLPETIAVGDPGHIAAHQDLHTFRNLHRKPSGGFWTPLDWIEQVAIVSDRCDTLDSQIATHTAALFTTAGRQGWLEGATAIPPSADKTRRGARFGLPHTWRLNDYSAARFPVLVLGDSNSYPQVVTTAQLWQSLLANDLKRAFGNGGGGFYGTWRSEWTNTGTVNVVQPIEAGGPFPAVFAPYGYAKYFVGNANLITFTLPAGQTCTNFEIYYLDDNSITQSGDYSIDGGAYVTGALTQAGAAGLKRLVVNSAITSTLRIRGGNGLLPTFIVGVAIYNGTTGCVVHSVSRGGVALRDIANDPVVNGAPNPAGSGANAAGLTDDRLQLIDFIQPKLTICNLLENDLTYLPAGNTEGFPAQAPTDIDVYEACASRLVARCQQYGDVVMVAPQYTDPASLVAKYWATGPAPMPGGYRPDLYVDRLYSVSGSLGCSVLSFGDVLGSYSDAVAAGLQSDSFHLNVAGQRRLAGYLSRLLRAA